MSLMLRKWILNSIIKGKPAKKPVAQLSRIESLPEDSQFHHHIKLACISDKEKFIRAIFTKDSLAVMEQNGGSLEDIKGGIIGLQDYALIASVGTDRRYSEYIVEVHKFTFIGGERNMPVPTVTNVNLDERVQLKLAQLWREAQSNSDHAAVMVYSQVEDSQLSQDELSVLLLAMTELSQVHSISPSQRFDLENIPGWLKTENGSQLDHLALPSQETEYGTPLLEIVDSGSNDASESDGTANFKTPPQGLILPSNAGEDLNQQQQGSNPMDDNELPICPPQCNDSPQTEEVMQLLETSQQHQQTSSDRVNDMSKLVEQASQNVSKILSNPTSTLTHILSSQRSDNNGSFAHNDSVPGERADDVSYCWEISDSQVVVLDTVWSGELLQPSLPTSNGVTSNEQPCSSGALCASSVHSNRHDCNNSISNNGCSVETTAASSWQQEDQARDKQALGCHQQEEQSSGKGKGGTTKDIYHVDKPVTVVIGRGSVDVTEESDISITSSQQDELDKQWLDDDGANNSIASSLETFDDLHPFQLASLQDQDKMATDHQPSVTECSSDQPGPSSNVIVTVESDLALNQGDTRLAICDDSEMDIDSSDQHLLGEAESEGGTSPTPANLQTSVVSTAAITRLLDVSNKAPPAVEAFGDKTVPGLTAFTSNVRLTPSRVMTSSHKRALTENPASSSEEDTVPSTKKRIAIKHNDPDGLSDISDGKPGLANKMVYQLKPLISEEEIDEFIETYWALQRLRTFS